MLTTMKSNQHEPDLFAAADKPLNHMHVMSASETPANAWERDGTKRTLDELFSLTHQYRNSEDYHALIKFVARFRSYSPYNALLLHVQMPGARFVAPPNRWLRDYRRAIKPGARPIVILQPMGPVMFVFDVSETEPMEDAPPLPPEVENPFEVTGVKIGTGLCRVIENGKRDGVRVIRSDQGSQSAGSITLRHVDRGVRVSQAVWSGIDSDRNPIVVNISVKYELVVNRKLSIESQYATIAHELAHLYCGHLGSPDSRWWPSRSGIDSDVAEFEAESITYLVCRRLGIESGSERYLANYVRRDSLIPHMSLELVMKTAGLIETMTKRRLKPRK